MDQSVAALQVALKDADWDIFWCSFDDVSMFIEAVVALAGKLAEDTVEKTVIRMFPNRKPWVDKTTSNVLRLCSAAYWTLLVSGNMDQYKAASYQVRRAVKQAMLSYRETL